jgi:hypothetical protein
MCWRSPRRAAGVCGCLTAGADGCGVELPGPAAGGGPDHRAAEFAAQHLTVLVDGEPD